MATGSPFDPVDWDGARHPIGQGNNAFVFLGIGFGTILARARKITDDMVLEAAYALADYTEDRYLRHGLVYPPIADLRETSVRVAARVLGKAVQQGISRREGLPDDVDAYVRERFWEPRYLPFVRANPDERPASAVAFSRDKDLHRRETG